MLELVQKNLETSEPTAAALELTILMPCLNEAETIGQCVENAMSFLRGEGVAGEVLIADNGSEDGSVAIAVAAGARVIHVDQRGYGAALLGGVAAAEGRYVIMGDADESYDFTSLGHFLRELRQGSQLVMGNRFKGGIAPGAMPRLHRYLGNPVLSGIGRLFFRVPIGDFHCGLRGFDRQAIQDLDLNTTGMEFASEMVVKASLKGLTISEVPTTLAPDGRSRPPHLRSWRDGWRHLRFLLLFSPRWLFLYPGLTLMAVGLTSMIFLLMGPQSIAGLTLDVNTLVYCAAALICGYQAVAFAVFAKVYAINAGLLPYDRRLAVVSDLFSMEVGLLIGLALILAGFIATGFALQAWGAGAFGDLDPVVSLRIVVPAVTALVLGGQTLFASFFLSVLSLRTRGN